MNKNIDPAEANHLWEHDVSKCLHIRSFTFLLVSLFVLLQKKIGKKSLFVVKATSKKQQVLMRILKTFHIRSHEAI